MRNFQNIVFISTQTFHERNVQMSVTEIYKVSNNFSPPQTNEIYEIRNEPSYNLRQNSRFT